MNAQVKTLVPALALAAALSLPSVAGAADRHAARHGRRDDSTHRYDSRSYRGHDRGHYRARPYSYSYRYRGHRPRNYGYAYGYAPVPPAYGYYGYYPPPPPYPRVRPHLGVSLYFGF